MKLNLLLNGEKAKILGRFNQKRTEIKSFTEKTACRQIWSIAQPICQAFLNAFNWSIRLFVLEKSPQVILSCWNF